MSTTYISAELRRRVESRSAGLCEYCLIAEDDTFFGREIDHIISEKHGGPTEDMNLAMACIACNQAKGSDIGSINWETEEFVRFYHPRTDHWANHFVLVGARIESRTAIGAVTARILGFNNAHRTNEREVLIELGRYPNAEARLRMM